MASQPAARDRGTRRTRTLPDGRPRVRRRLSAATAAEAGIRHVARLTGKPVEGVTSVQPSDGGWLVGVEVVEDRRIPSAADMLATYEAELDTEGRLLGYQRTRRYVRGRCDPAGEG